MIKKFCLCGCGEVLTGKQRRYAGEACRKRYERNGMSGFVLESSGLSGNLSGLSANRPGLINQRDFTVIFTITFAGNSNPGEWDLGLLDVSIKAEIARIIQNYLEYQYAGWKIRVKIVSKPQFTAF